MALSLQKIWIQNRKQLLLLHPLIHCCDTTLNKVNGAACGGILYQAALRVCHLFVQLSLQSIASSTLFGSAFFINNYWIFWNIIWLIIGHLKWEAKFEFVALCNVMDDTRIETGKKKPKKQWSDGYSLVGHKLQSLSNHCPLPVLPIWRTKSA